MGIEASIIDLETRVSAIEVVLSKKTGTEVLAGIPGLSIAVPSGPPERVLPGAEKKAAEIVENGYAVISDSIVECPGYPPVSAGDGYVWVPINTLCKDRKLWEKVAIR